MAPTIDHTIKTRLLLRPLKSPLGTIRLGGVNQGGFGVGRPDGPERSLSCYGFVHITHGSGVYTDTKKRVTIVNQGDVVFFFPGVPHRCHTRPDEFWDEIWFEFEGPIFDLMRKTGLLDPKRPIYPTHDTEQWFRRLFQIVPPVHLRQKTAAQVIVSRFVSLLTEILGGSETPDVSEKPQDEWLDTACELLVSRESGQRHEPAAVARQLGLSYETFRKRFRALIGFSPGRFQLDSRIDRAAALLHQGRLTIKEISAQLDFCDEFYFSRCFKRRFGHSPLHFRRRVRGG